MPRSVIFIMVLPVAFSVAFGSAVMADILQQPGRDLNMWPGASHDDSHGSMSVIGLASTYSVSEPVRVQVAPPEGFGCGDLYITVSSGHEPVTQRGFLAQCPEPGQSLPIHDEYREAIRAPGSYDLTVELVAAGDTISLTRGFTVE